MQQILVIRLGALGDLVFCMSAFAAIRAHHSGAEVRLLTRKPFADFARRMPWFDDVIVDTHPGFTQAGAWIDLLRHIKSFAPDRIYDLQGKTRQSVLYALLGGPFGAEWSGAAPLCKFPRLWPPRPGMHFTEFLAAQLARAGVTDMPAPEMEWLDAQVGRFALPKPYVVLIPGCSPGGEYKRWPAARYAELAQVFMGRGVACVTVGTAGDAPVIAAIKELAPSIIDLCGQTNLFELAGILRGAAGVIGNDTGPLHVAAAVEARTLALFSERTNPDWSKPPGPVTAWVQQDQIGDLSVDRVIAAFDALADHPERKSR